jgi:hypothetical protein
LSYVKKIVKRKIMQKERKAFKLYDDETEPPEEVDALGRDLEYERMNIGYNEQSPEGGIKCKNYEICHAVLPKWWYNCLGCYNCTNCSMFGWDDLKFYDNLECPICLETKKAVEQPSCGHSICVPCFKRCYYGQRNNDPPFPYSEDIEDEYYNDIDNHKWEIEYPLITEYNEICKILEKEREIKYENEKNLRKCPICRR